MKKQIISFLIINIIFFIIGIGIKQRNPEELFLSDKNLKDLIEYRSQFGSDEITYATGVDESTMLLLEKAVIDKNGEFVDISRMYPEHAIFTLPKDLDDETKFRFFEEISTFSVKISFAGTNYTNSYLAGMSMRIQNFIFPIVFLLMFVCLLVIFRNFTITFYLFLTSFVGVSVGLAIVKILFSYSTILTSITPLVSFILTLANQMHVVFGINTYKTKTKFLKHKLQPMLIMMGTTVIGFSGLMFSDLISIRQFGIATTATLIITWGLNIFFLSNFNLDFNLPKLKFNFSFKQPSYQPLKAILLALLLLGSGIYSLNVMPTLVEAIFFFPKNHPVRIGHSKIENSFGGTPQVNLVIKKTDNSLLNFSDFRKIALLEEQLKSQKITPQIISANEIVSSANKKYSGIDGLPDNIHAYILLRGQIPPMLRNAILTPTTYNISFLSAPLSNLERKSMIDKVEQFAKNLPPDFSGKISGLNYLLLASQDSLVTTLFSSLLGSFLLITIIFSFFSRNIKEIFIFALISLSSIFGGLFLMYQFGFSLNVSSIMILSISIGLIDDSTIHLLYAQKLGESEETIRTSCILPIMFSNFVLFACFSLLGLESFIPIKEFAWGLVLMLSVGLSLDLLLLPMISRYKSSKK